MGQLSVPVTVSVEESDPRRRGTGRISRSLAIAGISLRRVMGFTVMSFFVGAMVFGLALLVLV